VTKLAKKKNKAKKNSQQKKNAAKVSNRNKQIKESKKETKILPAIIENIPADTFEEVLEIENVPTEETLSEAQLPEESKDDLPEIKEIILKKYEIIKEWATNNKKVSLPIIVAIYTVIVILITIFFHNHITNQSLSAKEQKLIEEMSNAESHNADISLVKNVPYETGNNILVEYCSYTFTDTVKAQNASELDNSYENTSSANTYLDVLVSYDNKGDKNLPAKNFSIMSIKIGDVVYPCFSAIETKNGKSLEFVTDEEVPGGEKAYIHYIFDVPEGEKTSTNPIDAKVIIDNVGYIINLR
jgi:hypothetical protein